MENFTQEETIEHNFKNMWCVFDLKDKPMLFSLGWQRKDSIKIVEAVFTKWPELKKIGYTCKKVNVKIDKV